MEVARKEAFVKGQAAAGEAAKRAQAERQEALKRAEALQKQLDLAGDEKTTRFLILFDQLQDTYKRMAEVLEGMERDGNAEKADKLRGALSRALAEIAG